MSFRKLSLLKGEYLFIVRRSDEEHALPSSSVFQRRAQALTIFVGYAAKPSSTTSSAVTVSDNCTIGDLVSLLIESATVHGDGASKTKTAEISNAARSSLSQLLRTMLATDFIAAVLGMLESGETRVSLFLP
jgi:U3 small nucleolar RNA-associated protein 10